MDKRLTKQQCKNLIVDLSHALADNQEYDNYYYPKLAKLLTFISFGIPEKYFGEDK